MFYKQDQHGKEHVAVLGKEMPSRDGHYQYHAVSEDASHTLIRGAFPFKPDCLSVTQLRTGLLGCMPSTLCLATYFTMFDWTFWVLLHQMRLASAHRTMLRFTSRLGSRSTCGWSARQTLVCRRVAVLPAVCKGSLGCKRLMGACRNRLSGFQQWFRMVGVIYVPRTHMLALSNTLLHCLVPAALFLTNPLPV
eukprot:354622-Chlamydomonas_euryale.AAC.22